MIGRIVSTKMNKTATVLIERTAVHPLYKKTFIQSKRFLADDPVGVKEGDLVEIIKVSPISKNKHFRVVKVIGKNLTEIVEMQEKVKAEQIIAEVMPEDKEGSRVQGIGSSEETKETEKLEGKKKRIRKEKDGST